jgi:radical SAM superfamily enzyme YgiQ (UPF0313 family)
MMKPGMGSYYRFKELFDKYSKEAGKEQYLIPYFIAAHPGTTDDDMVNLAIWLKQNDFRLDQVQSFLPTPLAMATTMYHTQKNPLRKISKDSETVETPRTGQKFENFTKHCCAITTQRTGRLLREGLKRMGRSELIGNGPSIWYPDRMPAQARVSQHAKNETPP